MSYQPNEEENQAASLLRKRGWRVIAPVEKEPIKETGAYEVKTDSGISYFEGVEGEEEQIRAKFEALGRTIVGIVFKKDGFFDL